MNTPSCTSNASFDNLRCAAEEAAIQLGWLRECPYHGQPFRPARIPLRQAKPTARVSPELLALAVAVSDAYSDQCAFCARESATPE